MDTAVGPDWQQLLASIAERAEGDLFQPGAEVQVLKNKDPPEWKMETILCPKYSSSWLFTAVLYKLYFSNIMYAFDKGYNI